MAVKDKKAPKKLSKQANEASIAKQMGFETSFVDEEEKDQEDGAEADSNNDEDTATTKKRKRDTKQISEIEVDVDLPEPLSKKALRKAKKQKTSDGETESAPNDGSTADGLQSTTDTLPQATSPAAKTQSAQSIWIGNLPWTITKPMLTQFLTENSTPSILESSITRVHMPLPSNISTRPGGLKPHNKGFAYVDFADQQSFVAALALTETPFGGRRVLIKDANSFAGRPTEHGKDNKDGKEGASKTEQHQKSAKKPSKRVFVGNLSFDVTKDELRDHYSPCGTIENIHMATFEDSGKCKGYAWVTFETEEAAGEAVQGWTKVANKDDVIDEDAGEDEDTIVTKGGVKKTRKKRMMKWFVNRLQGRDLRVEFAEDQTTRYNKRFGKDRTKDNDVDVADPDSKYGQRSYEKAPRKTNASGISPGAPTDASMRRGRSGRGHDGVSDARYRTGGIVDSQGQKTTFD